MTREKTQQYCLYCKEEIKSGAIKCKHCNSIVPSALPPHEGICPFCKEEIHRDALKCKHCKSNLATGIHGACEGGDVGTASFIPSPDFISGEALKCTLEYLDCLDTNLNPSVCDASYRICLITEKAKKAADKLKASKS